VTVHPQIRPPYPDEVPSVHVGGHHLTVRAPVSQPQRDRSGAGAQLQTPPPRLDPPARQGVGVDQTFSQPQPVQLGGPVVAQRPRSIAVCRAELGGVHLGGAFGLAQRLQIPQGEAANYIKAYFARFPGIRAYMDRVKAECRERGYVETLFGRRCYIPGIRDSNPSRRGYAEREAINAPLQGTAADIIKRAMIRIPAALAREGLRTRMLLQVHDELVFEAPEDEAERGAAAIKHVMEGACAPVLKLSVPPVVETGAAHNWDDAH